MKKKVYSSSSVRNIHLDKIVQGRTERALVVGMDIGKSQIYVVVRWGPDQFERPWVVRNPGEIGELVRLLMKLGEGRRMKVAMESTGTYGDALRQALADAQIQVHLVSGKRAH